MRIRGCVIALIVAGAICGCGDSSATTTSTSTTTTETFDDTTFEPHVLQRLARDVGVDPAGYTVDCPPDQPIENGNEFECTLLAPDGSTATVRIKVSDVVVSGGQIDYHYDAVVPKSQFK